jgi:hypothetical protein
VPVADLNAEDDEGRWWSLLRDAADPAAVVPGAVLIAGTDRFWSVVRIEQVDADGQVHFVAVPPDDPAAGRLLARSASSANSVARTGSYAATRSASVTSR